MPPKAFTAAHQPKPTLTQSSQLNSVALPLGLGRASDAEEVLMTLPLDLPAANILRGRVGLLNEDGWGALAVIQPLSESPPEGLEPQVLSVLAESYLLVGQPESALQALEGKAGADPDLVRLQSPSPGRDGAARRGTPDVATGS